MHAKLEGGWDPCVESFCLLVSLLFCHMLTRREKGCALVFGLQDLWQRAPWQGVMVYSSWDHTTKSIGNDLWLFLNKLRLHHRLVERLQFSLLVELIRGKIQEAASGANSRAQEQMTECG